MNPSSIAGGEVSCLALNWRLEIDGEPVAAVLTNNSVHAAADIMFSSALIYAGVPEHPEGHDMIVKSLRDYALQ
jgi:hypothetical protein